MEIKDLLLYQQQPQNYAEPDEPTLKPHALFLYKKSTFTFIVTSKSLFMEPHPIYGSVVRFIQVHVVSCSYSSKQFALYRSTQFRVRTHPSSSLYTDPRCFVFVLIQVVCFIQVHVVSCSYSSKQFALYRSTLFRVRTHPSITLLEANCLKYDYTGNLSDCKYNFREMQDLKEIVTIILQGASTTAVCGELWKTYIDSQRIQSVLLRNTVRNKTKYFFTFGSLSLMLCLFKVQ